MQEVDLGGVYRISKLIIWNRYQSVSASIGNNLAGATVTFFNADRQQLTGGLTLTGAGMQSYNVTYAQPTVSREESSINYSAWIKAVHSRKSARRPPTASCILRILPPRGPLFCCPFFFTLQPTPSVTPSASTTGTPTNTITQTGTATKSYGSTSSITGTPTYSQTGASARNCK